MPRIRCILALCIWTLAFLKVSIRVYGVRMEHVACHLLVGNFTTLRNAIQSICTRSLYFCFWRLCVRCVASWDSGNSANMSFRNLDVYHGDSYGSHRISIYTAHRRSIYKYIYKRKNISGIMRFHICNSHAKSFRVAPLTISK